MLKFDIGFGTSIIGLRSESGKYILGFTKAQVSGKVGTKLEGKLNEDFPVEISIHNMAGLEALEDYLQQIRKHMEKNNG